MLILVFSFFTCYGKVLKNYFQISYVGYFPFFLKVKLSKSFIELKVNLSLTLKMKKRRQKLLKINHT